MIFLAFLSLISLIPPKQSHAEDVGSNGRCVPSPIFAGNGSFVLYDAVVNVQSAKVYFIGPLNKLWIVPETPAMLKDVVSWVDNFGEGIVQS